MNFPDLAGLLTVYMLVLWALRPVFKNDGLVDFAWPSSFTIMAIFFLYGNVVGNNTGLVFCVLYIICGIRFMSGWLERTARHGEDPRWQLWRQRWRDGAGLLGLRNVSINFLVFYLVQQFANLTLIAFSMHLNTRATLAFGYWQLAGLILWCCSLALETWADFDLWQFKRNPFNAGKVCQKNLWRFSRHPNYFFELTLWTAYVVYSWPAATGPGEHLLLLTLVPMVYWFLVYFTGIPLTEARSLANRGTAYAEYQRSTNRFFPWFPRSE